jgi:hypothetical protein
LVELWHRNPQRTGQQIGDQGRSIPEHLDENLMEVGWHEATLWGDDPAGRGQRVGHPAGVPKARVD